MGFPSKTIEDCGGIKKNPLNRSVFNGKPTMSNDSISIRFKANNTTVGHIRRNSALLTSKVGNGRKNMSDNSLFYKKCNISVDSLHASRQVINLSNGGYHIKASCLKCKSYIKFLPHKEDTI